MVWLKRIPLLILKLLLLLVVTMMIKFQLPEYRYDFKSGEPLEIDSVNDLSIERIAPQTFAAVRGKANFERAATYATHGVPFTYFLLEEYGEKLVVRAPELVGKDWTDVNLHVGRLRPYHRMPFSRSVRSGFHQLFGITIPADAYFLARDDVPKANGWSIGALIFASILWCVLVYFFFIHRWTLGRRPAPPSERAEGETTRADHAAQTA